MLKLKEHTQVKVLLWQQLGNRQSGSFHNLNNEKNTDTQRQITQAKSFNKFPPGASGNDNLTSSKSPKCLKIQAFRGFCRFCWLQLGCISWRLG